MGLKILNDCLPLGLCFIPIQRWTTSPTSFQLFPLYGRVKFANFQFIYQLPVSLSNTTSHLNSTQHFLASSVNSPKYFLCSHVPEISPSSFNFTNIGCSMNLSALYRCNLMLTRVGVRHYSFLIDSL